jgi:general stress protein 26
MKIETQSCKGLTQLSKLIEAIPAAMLTSLDFGGALVSKPIIPLEMDSGGAIWFFIDLRSSGMSHLCMTNLNFNQESSGTYLSLSGCCEINKNQAHIERLWTDSARFWFPDGLQAKNLVLLKFVPYAAEYWDASQGKMVNMYSMFSAVVSSKPKQLSTTNNHSLIEVNKLSHITISPAFSEALSNRV